MARTRFLIAPVIALALAGCGINPVTGKHEIQFVSQADEVKLGGEVSVLSCHTVSG